MAIGSAIRKARLKTGLTQEQLGSEAGITRQHVNNIEHGRGDLPLSTALRLARILGMRDIPLDEGVMIQTPAVPEWPRRHHDRAGVLARRVARQAAELAELLGQPAVRADAPVALKEAGKHPLADVMTIRDAPLRAPQRHLATDDWVDVAVEGRVAAGPPIDYEYRDTRRVPPDKTPETGWSVLEAYGDSMIDFEIESGDLVYVEPRVAGVAATGEVVIGWLNDGLVIKRWEHRKGRRYLVSGNADLAPRELTADDQFELRAIVRRVVKRQPRTIDFPDISGKKRRRP